MAPILFEFSRITVFSLWFFIATGFIAGTLVFTKLAKRFRVELDILFDNSVLIFVVTLIISRLFFLLTHLDQYRILEIFNMWDKGFSFWGGFFAWTMMLWYLSFRRGESAGKIFDVMLPGLALGLFFGHIGAFLDGINHGGPTEIAWGVSFRSPNVKYITTVHPTQLYAAFYTLIVCIVSYALYKKYAKTSTGIVTEVSVLLYSAGKFTEEFFRGDETVKIFGIRIAHLLSFIALCTAAYLLYVRLKPHVGQLRNHLIISIKKISSHFGRKQQSL